MATWYTGPLLALAVWLGPSLTRSTAPPDRPCTAKTLACWQWTASDAILHILVPVLLSCLVASLVTLAIMVRRGGTAAAAGTVAAITGWLAGPLALLLLIEVWFLAAQP